MKVTSYSINNADNMKKTFAWLNGYGVAYAFYDYKLKTIVTPGKLKVWTKGVGWKTMVTTRRSTWRRIPDVRRVNLNAVNVLAPLDAIMSAMRRLILEVDRQLLVGVGPDKTSRVLNLR